MEVSGVDLATVTDPEKESHGATYYNIVSSYLDSWVFLSNSSVFLKLMDIQSVCRPTKPNEQILILPHPADPAVCLSVRDEWNRAPSLTGLHSAADDDQDRLRLGCGGWVNGWRRKQEQICFSFTRNGIQNFSTLTSRQSH